MRGHSILIASWAVVVSIILNGGLLCSGCFLEEKHALLDFKASLNVTTNAHLILSSWTGKEGDGANADCCTWEGVKCSNITGRIVEADLSFLRENMDEDWYVNISTFIPLKDLRTLDLSNNYFNSEVTGCRNWAKLQNLKSLYLDWNNFNNSIIPCISAITELKRLSLSNLNLEGSFPIEEFKRLEKLEFLDLSGNQLSGSLSFKELKLENLKVLKLEYTNFNKLSDVEALTSLKALSLYDIGINDSSVLQGICSLKNLHELDLSRNNFYGPVPMCFRNLTSLRLLDLSNNILSGNIPAALITPLVHLEYLSLSGNLFGDLEFLDLSKNQLIGPLPACSELTSLKFIHLHHNMISGPISNMLSGSFNLMTLDLGYNKLSGGIPRYIGKLKELRVLLLGGNELLGHIPLHLCQLQNVTIMDLSQNKFSGPLPTCFNKISFGSGQFSKDAFFTNDPSFRESERFPGYPRSHFLAMKIRWSEYYITFSDQENVIFTTKRRSERYAGNILNFMSGLDLSCNQLIGAIPPEFGDLRHIRALNLSHNYLQGSIPSRLSMLNLVESLDLSYNNFSGEIPSELASLNFLSIFNVSYNNLSGRVPDTGEFATFDDSNYRGNPGLCGPLLKRSCNPFAPHPENVGDQDIEVDGAIDVAAFYWSFFASYMVIVISFVVILCVSPYYRRAWSFYIDYWILSRFYEYCGSRSSEKKQTWKVFNWNMRRR
nr:receptor-like protein 9b [Coffea arabica]